MKLIFDTSALLNLIRSLGSDAFRYFNGNYILTLTPYEIGNALWREATLLNRIPIDEAYLTLNLITSSFKVLNIITPSNTLLILKLAYELKITYYDSSYLVASYELNAKLVTDDERLKRKIQLEEDLITKILGGKIMLYSTKELINN
jgi:predicted nucleic acid-binding protein